MPLAPGTKLGPYEILAPLGAGGMGEVYRGRDTKLDRQVAVKVLPASVARDPERLARFEREAKVLASLNHPNIAQIYGVQEADGYQALVMELVPGETLAARIKAGAIPLDESLRLAGQMVEALSAAHDKGITHRDFKPANVMITPEGVVKVLDFGIAAVSQPSEAPSGSHVPTLTLSPTSAGMIMGTAPYMSPEQARGNQADRRSDIFSFAIVLYEMLTGKQLFHGDTVSDVLASVLKDNPNLEDVPEQVRPLLERCLQKDPKKRLQSIGDWDLLLNRESRPASSAPTATAGSSRLAWIAAAVFAIAAAVLGIDHYRAGQPTPRPLLHISDDLNGGLYLPNNGGGGSPIALSPDGTQLAFLTRASDGMVRVAIRALNTGKDSVLAATDGAWAPFWSPDGKWIGFFANAKLMKVPSQGGAPIQICEALQPRGGTWADDGTILFNATSRGPVMSVSSNGGMPRPLTKISEPDRENHRYPQALPGGDTVLFTHAYGNGYDMGTVDVYSKKTGIAKVLVPGAYFGKYSSSGHLLYMRGNTLYAAPMDLARLEITGAEMPILEDVYTRAGNGLAYFDVGRAGEFAYVPNEAEDLSTSLYWLDATGRLLESAMPPGQHSFPSISPDGAHIAFRSTVAGATNIAVYEAEANRLANVTAFKGVAAIQASYALWWSDGRHLAVGVSLSGFNDGIRWIRADAAGQPERLLAGRDHIPRGFLSNNRLLYVDVVPPYRAAVLALNLADPDHPKAGEPEVLFTSDAPIDELSVSPDGKWMAYASAEGGGVETYVRPTASSKVASRWLVSSGGGGTPHWSRNGHELLYQHRPDGRPWVVPYTVSGDTFVAGKPHPWIDKLPIAQIPDGALSPDGKRFALFLPAGQPDRKPPSHVTFLLNFTDELKRKAPLK